MQTFELESDLSGELPELELVLDEHHRVVVKRPVLWRPTSGLLAAWPNSALVVPAPWTGGVHPVPLLFHAVHQARALESGCVLVSGWTAESGESGALAQARAAAIEALVGDDAKAWVELAAGQGSLADVLAYLDHLRRVCGFACPVDTITPIEGEATRAAVSAFQSEYNARFDAAIDVDGVCGEQTLAAVFAVLRFEWERWATKYGLSPADLDGTAFEYVAASDRGLAHAPAEPDGGVEVLVLERRALGGRAPGASLVYGSGVARIEPLPISPEPGGWRTGPYTVITDVSPGEAILPEIYNLRATDGSWAQGLVLPDEAVDNGFLELRFTDLPCDRRFRLDVEIPGVGVYEIFADLAYGELHAFAESCGRVP